MFFTFRLTWSEKSLSLRLVYVCKSFSEENSNDTSLGEGAMTVYPWICKHNVSAIFVFCSCSGQLTLMTFEFSLY
jgi:hypothetical protein